MPFPDTSEFRQILSSIRRTDPKDPNFESVQVKDEQMAVTHTGSSFVKKAKFLWFDARCVISIQALIEKIKKELKKPGHAANDQIAKAILLFLTLDPFFAGDPVKKLNRILQSSVSCEVSQFFILTNAFKNRVIPVEFGQFILGNLNTKSFQYKCERAQSDYFDLYGEALKDLPSIERKRINGYVLNWPQFFKETTINTAEFVELLLVYFEAVSAELFEDFWTQFNEQQIFHVAKGIPFLDDRQLRETVRTENITIFLKMNFEGVNRGYVVPTQTGFLNFVMPASLASDIRSFYTEAKEKFNFLEFTGSEIHQTTKTFCRFVTKGYRYLQDDKPDEGFLHFVIAIDLLLGEKEDTTKSVTRRCAVLTFTPNDKSYEEQKRIVSEIYEARSKYVHRGISNTQGVIDHCKAVCTQLFYCLLKIQDERNSELKDLTIDRWKKTLDYACGALEADRNLDKDVLIFLGR